MPKEIKGNPRRKPPEPASRHSDIDEWLERLMPRLKPIVRGVDESIRAGLPDLEFAVKYNRAFYGRRDLGWIVEVAPYHVSVNVLFLGGADLDPPPPLGTVGRTRYVKIRNVDEVRTPELLEWIEQAGRTQGWK
jgi:hypothetical protein